MIMTILIINIIYVSFFTIRMILTMKGQKLFASIIGAIEITVYVVGLGLVLDNIDEIQNLIAYALGFGLGVFTGIKIEEWLAIGYVTVKVITNKDEEKIAETLRDNGFGVTSWIGEGRDGPRLMMEILTRRKDQRDLYNQILAYDSKAFIVSHEPQHFRGGFWLRNLKKQAKQEGEDITVVNEENLPGIDQEAIKEYKEEYEATEKSTSNHNS